MHGYYYSEDMDPNNPFPFDYGAMAGLGIVFFLIWLVSTVLIVILAIWIHYTIMWRAVRRGMREFHYGGKVIPQQQVTQPVQQVTPPVQ